MTDAETAVLDAARKWIEAKEAMLAVDESREGDPTETGHALDQAKYELTEAVYRLIGREPPLPLRANRRIHRSERARASNCKLMGWTAPQRHQRAKMRSLIAISHRKGTVHGADYHDRVGPREERLPGSRCWRGGSGGCAQGV